jgi:hypothetical protein
MYWSTPPNIDYKRKSQTKFMADAQKAYKELGDEEGEKVRIPNTFEDSDSDNDSFVIKVKKLTRMGEAGQSSKDNDGNFNQIWYMDTCTHENAPIKPCEDITSLKNNIIDGTDLSELDKTQSLLSNKKQLKPMSL